jgi:hypothetical protein
MRSLFQARRHLHRGTQFAVGAFHFVARPGGWPSNCAAPVQGARRVARLLTTGCQQRAVRCPFPERSHAMNTQQVADRLVALCREGKYEQAQDELYADDAASVEMKGSPGGTLGNVKGLDAIREKGRKWAENLETIHGGTMSDPVVAGDWFSVASSLDATYKSMGRMAMQEICVYKVRGGKIVHEQFFYNT